MFKRYRLTNLMICFAGLVIVFTATGTKGSDTIVLENSRLALSIAADDGAIRSMHDKGLDIHYKLKGLAFELSANDATIKGLKPKDVQQSPGKVTLNYETLDFTIDFFTPWAQKMAL